MMCFSSTAGGDPEQGEAAASEGVECDGLGKVVSCNLHPVLWVFLTLAAASALGSPGADTPGSAAAATQNLQPGFYIYKFQKLFKLKQDLKQ